MSLTLSVWAYLCGVLTVFVWIFLVCTRCWQVHLHPGGFHPQFRRTWSVFIGHSLGSMVVSSVGFRLLNAFSLKSVSPKAAGIIGQICPVMTIIKTANSSFWLLFSMEQMSIASCHIKLDVCSGVWSGFCWTRTSVFQQIYYIWSLAKYMRMAFSWNHLRIVRMWSGIQ